MLCEAEKQNVYIWVQIHQNEPVTIQIRKKVLKCGEMTKKKRKYIDRLNGISIVCNTFCLLSVHHSSVNIITFGGTDVHFSAVFFLGFVIVH